LSSKKVVMIKKKIKRDIELELEVDGGKEKEVDIPEGTTVKIKFDDAAGDETITISGKVKVWKGWMGDGIKVEKDALSASTGFKITDQGTASGKEWRWMWPGIFFGLTVIIVGVLVWWWMSSSSNEEEKEEEGL